MTPKLSYADHDRIYELVFGKEGKTVTVDRQAMRALLADHQRLWDRVSPDADETGDES